MYATDSATHAHANTDAKSKPRAKNVEIDNDTIERQDAQEKSMLLHLYPEILTS